MASRGQSVTITYVAWDTSANAGKAGDAANHTLRWVKDGTSSAPTNAPAEVDGANAPGVYKLALTAAECTCDVGTLGGKSSTAGVAIIPLSISFEQLPTAAPAAANGLLTVGAGAGQLQPDGSGRTNVGMILDVAVTLDGNNFLNVNARDWGGTQIAGGLPNTTTPPTTSAIATAVWQDLTAGSDFATVGSIGKLLATNIDTAITSRLASSNYTAPPSAASIATTVLTDTTGSDLATVGSLGYLIGHAPGWYTAPATPPTAAAIATAVWQDTTAGDFSVVGSIGLKVATNLDTNVGSRLAAAAPPANWSTMAIDTNGRVQVQYGTAAGQVNLAGGNLAGAVPSVAAAVTVGTNNDKAGYSLAATGLDSISVADPGGVAGMTTFPKMMVAVWRRLFRKSTQTATQLKTYADDGATVNTTQALADDGTTQTQGAAT
jgi:hypothetical protein